MTREAQHRMVADYIRSHPESTWQKIAGELDISLASVSRIAKEFGLSRPVGLKKLNMELMNEGAK